MTVHQLPLHPARRFLTVNLHGEKSTALDLKAGEVRLLNGSLNLTAPSTHPVQ